VNRFNVVMTAPGLAAAAVALLERAGCVLHTMPPFPSAEAVADLTGRVQAGADVLSPHCPLTPETPGLIDASALAAPPPGALLINTARGGIVDEAAVLAALTGAKVPADRIVAL
jgi:phosphoglycerate dehydrogenase-like enzyme